MAVDVPIGMVGRHLAQEVVGRVVVDERVVIVGEEVACIVESAQGQQRVEEVGTAEEEVAVLSIVTSVTPWDRITRRICSS